MPPEEITRFLVRSTMLCGVNVFRVNRLRAAAIEPGSEAEGGGRVLLLWKCPVCIVESKRPL